MEGFLKEKITGSLKTTLEKEYNGKHELIYIKKNGIKIFGVATVFGDESNITKEEFFEYINNGGQLIQKPIWLEHFPKYKIGKIIEYLVEGESDKLHILFHLPYNRELEKILPYIKNGFLKDLSIHYKRKIDKNGKIIPNTLNIIEVSVTSDGAVGQSTITTMHSKNSSNRKKKLKLIGKKKKLILFYLIFIFIK